MIAMTWQMTRDEHGRPVLSAVWTDTDTPVTVPALPKAS